LKNLKLFIAIGVLSLAAFKLLHAGDWDSQYHSSEEFKWNVPIGKSYNYADIKVNRVIDGDTLLLENGERVRLIGIDTPEIHESAKLDRDAKRSEEDKSAIKELGMRSYEFTRDLIEGQNVSLEFDVEKYDKYGRILAYVFRNKDNKFVNAEIIEQGYASLMTIPPNVKYASLFQKLYTSARENKRGLWK
jgi:micrococcal nuclease